jgi:tetratricopeptide (TPR) repeat protein
MAVVYEIVEKVEQAGNKDHLANLLRAIKDTQDGQEAFANGLHAQAIDKYESALRALDGIPDVAVIRAWVLGGMVGPKAALGQLKEAVRLGSEAVKGLPAEPRLQITLAGALHDLGGALAQSGQLEEGIQRMEQGLRLFERDPEGADGAAICLRNLKAARRALEAQKNSGCIGSWLRRILGR